MYKYPKGIVAVLIVLSGLIITTFSLLVCFGWAIEVIKSARTDLTLLGSTIPYGVLWLVPLYIGMFMLGLFPAIRVVPQGLKYQGVAGFVGLIKWDEIENLIRFDNGVVALVINRKGLWFFNGLYFNRLYGLLARNDKPVMFLAPSLDQRDLILNEILSKSPATAIRKPKDLYA